MLEKLVAWILNSYLGEYLELNTDQLTIGILSGQVHLENVSVKRSAFDKLDLPLQVKSGSVGKVHLSIPVAGFRSQPWVINISDVDIVIGPKPPSKFDEEAAARNAKSNKKQMLEELEVNWKLDRQPGSLHSSSSWMSYGTELAANIIENLQLNLTNVNVQYEGEFATSAHTTTSYAFGLHINKLTAQTADSSWHPIFVSSFTKTPIVYKIVELQGFSLYWDTYTAQSADTYSQNHNHLLEPVSGKAFVKHNTSAQPLKSQSEPRLNVELRCEEVSISLDNIQYRGIASLLREFELYEARKPYRSTRPLHTIKEAPRVWWQHAIKSVTKSVSYRNERLHKDFILQRCRECVCYVEIYYSVLTGEKLSHHQNRDQRKIESEFDFDTLKTLRLLAVDRVKEDDKWYQESESSNPNSSSAGYISSWINWYTSKADVTTSAEAPVLTASTLTAADVNLPSSASSSSLASGSSQKTLISESSGTKLKLTSPDRAKLEKEIKDWVGGEPAEMKSILHKDVVFLQANFVLQQIGFKLLQCNQQNEDKQGIVQIECNTIQSALTLRPRIKSSKITLSLGGLYIKDLYTATTTFPLLISPRQQEMTAKLLGAGMSSLLTRSSYHSNSPHGSTQASSHAGHPSNIFYLEVERNPPNSSKDIKIQVKTEPLDIIYNDSVVNRVKLFFSPRRRSQFSREMSEFHLAEKARWRYEQLKNKTKIDIQDTWDTLLSTSTLKSSKRVGLKLDISAPQFIVPQDPTDSKTYMVVFDLGRLKVSNLLGNDEQDEDISSDDKGSTNKNTQDDDDDLDDEFVTPRSTPPEEAEQELGLPLQSISEQDLYSGNLYDKMYDRYEVLLADIQILIVNRKDNWRLFTNKGFSHLHIIDKLNINFLFERRLLLTADPGWPAVKVSALVESLSIHFSELKLKHLNKCIEKLNGKKTTAANQNAARSASSTSATSTMSESSSNTSLIRGISESESNTRIHLPHSHSLSRMYAPPEARKLLDNAKVVTLGLDIHQMSLDIHSKERCLVELQVLGVKLDSNKRPSESKLSLTVHSLIVADAMQTYGSDYELLVASHRNVRLDSKSGSICSSAIASPTSPMSPRSPSPPRSPDPELHTPARKQTSITSFQNAVLSGIQKLLPVASATPMVEPAHGSLRPPSDTQSDLRALSPVFQGEPLIKIDYTQTFPYLPEDAATRVVDIDFNTLDIVANQETIVELVSFFSEVAPSSPPSTSAPHNMAPDEHEKLSTLDSNHKQTESSNKTLQKVNTTVSAEFRKLNIMLHCPSVKNTMQQIFRSADQLITPVDKVAMIGMSGARIQASSVDDKPSTIEAELGGVQVTDLTAGTVHAHVFAFGNMDEEEANPNQTIPAHMYQTCVDESLAIVEQKAFQLIYSQADGIQTIDSLQIMMGSIQYVHVPQFLNLLTQSAALFQEYIERAKQKIRAAASEVAESFVNNPSTQLECLMQFDIEITLETPLLVLPSTNTSTEVIVAELGRMTVTNKRDVTWDRTRPISAADIIDIQVRDMKLVTKEVDPQKTVYSSGQEVIIDECGFDLSVIHRQTAKQSSVTEFSTSEDFDMDISEEHKDRQDNYIRQINVVAELPDRLQVSLSRNAYVLIQLALQNASQPSQNTCTSQTNKLSSPMLLTEQAEQTDDTANQAEVDDAENDFVRIRAHVSVPTLSVLIKDQLGGSQTEGIVELTLDEFTFNYEKTTAHLANVKCQLASLSVIDLLQPENSVHRNLVLSSSTSNLRRPKFISSSLPGSPLKYQRTGLFDKVPSSLPLSMTDSNIRIRSLELDSPVPSPLPHLEPMETGYETEEEEDNLVTVTAVLLDTNSPQFRDSEDKINKTLNIDFNSLEIIINQETWVMVLDFLGMGAKVFTQEQQRQVNVQQKTHPPKDGMKASLSVNGFTLIFVKPCYDLAKANVAGLSTQIIKRGSTTTVSGELRSIYVEDLSPHGRIHRYKFITSSHVPEPTSFSAAAGEGERGDNNAALSFIFKKFDVPDENLDREFDVSIDLTMSSVIYTHTKRFPIELINFLQDFVEHHDKLGHMRAASTGQQVPTGPGHAPRIRMNIKAATPVIILPGSSLSEQAVVMHLGNLSVSNEFLFAGQPGTLAAKQRNLKTESVSAIPDLMTRSVFGAEDMMTSSIYCGPDEGLRSTSAGSENIPCLLDVMSVHLTEMDLYSACRVEGRPGNCSINECITFKGYYLIKDKNQPLRERCRLDLVVERNLDNDLSHSSPELAIRGTLSSVHCLIDVDQYKLVRAVLDQNLGEELNDLQRLAKQLPQIQTILTGNVWTVIDLSIDLKNVTIELLQQHELLSSPVQSLARLDFIDSKLVFVGYSNAQKDIDLVSDQIRVSDARADSTSAFKQILEPTGSQDNEESDLHMEIHLRSSKEKNCASLLFNRMRIVCDVSWFVLLANFLANNPEKKRISEVPRISPAVARNLAQDNMDEEVEKGAQLELKLNLTETEVLVIEELSNPNSYALIMKTTAYGQFDPSSEHRPFFCNLQKMELFSCCLGAETSSALSIIDPFDVTFELSRLDAHSNFYNLETQLPNLSIRFSYNDMLLIKRILDTLPPQINAVLSQRPSERTKKTSVEETLVSQEAVISGRASVILHSVVITCDKISVCLINDCADMDIPLFELILQELSARQMVTAAPNQREPTGHVTFEQVLGGGISFMMSLDYYNRSLSGWEPMIEPWRLDTMWNGSPLVDQHDIGIKLTSDNWININVTSALLKMVDQTKIMWETLSQESTRGALPQSNRGAFVPYSLCNQTGRDLLFAVVCRRSGSTVSLPTSWTEVKAGECQPFFCSTSSKLRHQETRESTRYQIVIMIEGWVKSSPISIDKVGQFFRTIEPDPLYNTGYKVVDTRIVIDVVCTENASKCITVKSPVSIKNKTSRILEARLECINQTNLAQSITLEAGCVKPLPLELVFSRIWFREAGNGTMTYADKFITTQNQRIQPGDVESTPLICNSSLDLSMAFRMCAVVKRQGFPRDSAETRVLESFGEQTILYQPGHTITILPPFTLVNLLPVNLGFSINRCEVMKLKPGKELQKFDIDVLSSIEIKMMTENFQRGGALFVSTGASDHLINVCLYDSENRVLNLDAKIYRQAQGAVKVTISAKYWMINHTGLPLIFKQIGTKEPAAGQFEEHEFARSVEPLMFSLCDKEQPELCCLRLGNSVHPAGRPMWSHRFRIDSGNHVTRVGVTPSGNRPEWVYNMGVEVTRGTGRYLDTCMVTVVPYNKIINKSSYEIAFTQKFLAQQNTIDQDYQASRPGASQAFHWPRVDLDQLLCVKVTDIPGCLWSGGFRIDKLNSLVINLRNADSYSECLMLRVETLLSGSTFTTIISDMDEMPAPLRIENYSDLHIKYWQSDIHDEAHKAIVKPKSAVPYAWDEPTLSPCISCSIHCDMAAAPKVYNMEDFQQVENLEYANYFYLCQTGSPDSLVLDVRAGNAVIFSKREPGRRSQLWSQNVEGRIIHEGTTTTDSDIKFCLDIAELTVKVEGCSCLALRKVDSRRQSTQLWKFQGGRLICGIPGHCVQSLPAFGGMQPDARVALGPYDSTSAPSNDEKIESRKMLSGSGVLSVHVLADGPTRVLQICDIHDLGNLKNIKLKSIFNEDVGNKGIEDKKSNQTIRLTLALPGGIGISLVNKTPEELAYISLSHIEAKVTQTSDTQRLEFSVQHVQMDNQYADGKSPVLIYSIPSKRKRRRRDQPKRSKEPKESAIELDWQRMLDNKSSMHVFKLLSLRFSNFALDIDELILMKLLEMFTAFKEIKEVEDIDRIQLPKDKDFHSNVKKYYFSLLEVSCGQLTLSVHHTSSLPPALMDVKRRMGITTLITFENAKIDFDPFIQKHPFESVAFLMNAAGAHFQQELMSQAVKILGAVDLLGNPLGLVNDVTSGVHGLVTEGNVGLLLKNVTHGASNSLAKVAGTLSQGLGWITLDENHEESRELIKRQYGGSNAFLAGFKSLSHGLIGGLTSVVQQAYDGGAQRGIEGVISGIGKGLVGTVTKPVVGVLDFTSGAATAIRDTSGGGGGLHTLQRRRPTRCCHSMDGLLPVYSEKSSQGQKVLYLLNNDKTDEKYLDHIRMSTKPEGLTILVSDQRFYILKLECPSDEMKLSASYDELDGCTIVQRDTGVGSSDKFNVKMVVNQFSELRGQSRRMRTPEFECSDLEVAERIINLVDLAKSKSEEHKQTVTLTTMAANHSHK